VLPTLLDMLDQPDTVDMVLPSVLAVVELLPLEDYSSLVRYEMKKLLRNTKSVQVRESPISDSRSISCISDSDDDDAFADHQFCSYFLTYIYDMLVGRDTHLFV